VHTTGANRSLAASDFCPYSLKCLEKSEILGSSL
jgi:hypothetical protein